MLVQRQTVGLVTAEEFRKKREDLQNRKSASVDDLQTEEQQQEEQKKKKKKKRKATKMGPLSFNLEGSDNEAKETVALKPVKKNIKNPYVETDFLPDKERQKEEARERQRLRAEWEAQQEIIRNCYGISSDENVTVTYSYWDGSGHRREITVRAYDCVSPYESFPKNVEQQVQKKTTIGKYLELVKQQLVSEFAELRGVGAGNLLYVKEDLIIPHHYSFYDLIVTKARGKSGPLFHFDVHDDVRLLQDRLTPRQSCGTPLVRKEQAHISCKSLGGGEQNVDACTIECLTSLSFVQYDPNVIRKTYTIHGD
ncbi:hypothetical protein PsorP6_002452 [Peronosclerospora sorghi]|uniref:Uncharacterized protein n=1 Tax=Peronosclerospora sorghi TaxID=230839 RepID=A0ACC0WWZ6_9STRA|nr:hypothetical protein PsorP6_002452 [Peronosclerospora sorghi]